MAASAPNTQKVVKFSKLQVNTAQLDVGIPLMWGQRRMSINDVWYNNFTATAVSPKGKGATVKGGSQNFTYTASVILALGEGPFDSCLNVFQNGSTSTAVTLAKAGYTLYFGTASQSPEPFVTSEFPAEALAYAYTGYVFNPKLSLGSSASVPNDAFEMRRLLGFTDTLSAPGWKNPVGGAVTTGIDVNLADILADALTNPQYGDFFESSDIGDLTAARQYWDSVGLYYSPLLTNQEKFTAVLDRWAQISNSWIYWDGLQLRVLPLGDTAVGTFTPDLSPAYDLDVAHGDFLDNPPVNVHRKDPADCYNRSVFEFCDRTRGYVANPAVFFDQTAQDLYGRRDGSSTQADEICNPAVAAVAVQLYGKRVLNIRKTYDWNSPFRFFRLIPGSIVTLTSPSQGLNKELVRIRQVDEDEKGSLKFTAEELPGIVGTFVSIATQGNGPQTNASFNQDPGNVNTPAIVEPNSSLTNGIAKLLVSASGGANWGGCHVHLSFDNGASYAQIGEIALAAPQGLLTSGLASFGGPNPDVTHTLAIDATESLTVPQAVSNADAQAFRSLSVVASQPASSGGFMVMPTNYELLAFGNVAGTGTYAANLTYLERGLYGTTAGAHITGDQFSVLDASGMKGCTIAYTLPAQYIGQPVCVKLTSFNTFGLEEQDLTIVTAYKYTPTGAGFGGGSGGVGGVPTVPTGLAASPGVGQNVISWNSNPSTDNVTAYKVYRAPGLGASFGSASLVATVGTTNTWTDPGRPAGAQYTYFLKATNAVGDSAATAGVNCTTGATVVGALRPNGGTPGRKPNSGEELFNITLATGDVLPWDGSGGFKKAFLQIEQGSGGSAPTSTWTITIKKNGTTVATGTIAASATVGSFSGLTGDIVGADGDTLTGTCIAPQDATCKGVSVVIFGTRTQ